MSHEFFKLKYSSIAIVYNPHNIMNGIKSHLEFLTALRCMFELAFEMREPLADLVQYVVELHVLGIVLVELRLVLVSLFCGQDWSVGPAIIITI